MKTFYSTRQINVYYKYNAERYVSLKIYVGLSTEKKQNLLLNKTNLKTLSSACTHQGAVSKTQTSHRVPCVVGYVEKDMWFSWNCSDIFVGRTDDTVTSIFYAFRANNFI